jgi:hypothetical protein
MKRRYLSLIISPCLAAVLPTYVEAAHTVAKSPHLLAVADIPAILESTGGNPAAWSTPALLRDASPAEAARHGMPIAAWVPSTALSSTTRQTEVRTLLEQGVAVMVTSRAGEPRHELATFGVEPMGRTAIYLKTADGFSVTSVTADLDDPGAAAATQRASDVVFSAMLPQTQTRFESLADLAAAETSGTSTSDLQGERAFLRVYDQTIAKDGRSASQTIRITRDTTSSHDYKVIAVEAMVNVAPHENGLLMRRDDEYLTPYFVPDGESFHLYVPGAYHATTVLQWQGGEPHAQLLQAVPKTSGVTNRKITEEMASKSTLTASFSPDIQSGLNKDGVTTQGKVPFSLAFASETTQRSAIEMNVDDYSVSTTAQTHPWGLASTWTFPLANDISGNPDYFGRDKVSTKKMTPMMRRASLATASEWMVDGDYEQTILVASRGTVENRYFPWKGARGKPGREPNRGLDSTSRDLFNLKETGVPWDEGFDKNRYENGGIQPWIAMKVDLSSPYLTRSPTILIQSLSGLGPCLQADRGLVGLATCDKGKRSQQWNFEADSTYRNRADGGCLTTDPNTGYMSVAPCAGNKLNQQWEWSADRIHSHFSSAESWRLHVRNGSLNAQFDASRHQVMLPNPNHFLLRPWSSYPSPPSDGDWVPSLNGRPSPFQKIPGVDYRLVETTERWQTIPLHQGL